MPRELTLSDLLQSVSRRRSIVFWAVGSCLAAGVLACALTTRQYLATATVELQAPLADGLDRQSLMGAAPTSSDPLSADVSMQTQARILQSDTLALRTISSLHLDRNPQPTKLSRLWKFKHASQAPAASDAGGADAKMLAAFQHNLTVKPIGGTRLIEVSYLDKDPQVAAAVVNDLIRQLVTFGEEATTQATDEASRTLSKELEGLRSDSEQLQKRVANMQAKTGMYDQGTTDSQGREQAYSAILEQFQRSAAILSDATQNRILKEAIAHVAQTGDAELISSLAGNTAGGSAASSVTNSLGTIQSLRINEGQMQTQLDQLRVKFGPGYPKVSELQAGIAGLEQSIKEETSRITQRAANDSAVADRTYSDAKENYDRLKAQADALNSKTVDYRLTRQEADESRTLYSDLLKRLKEAGVLQGLRSSTLSIVDSARVPRSPAKPAVLLYLAIALGLGLIVSAFGVAIMELLDDTLTDFSAIEDMGLRLAGIVPRQLGKSDSSPDLASLSRHNDAIRSIRAVLMRKRIQSDATVVVVAPVSTGESTLQLAQSLTAGASQAGHRVLLVEANLDQPRVIRKLSSGTVINKLNDGNAKDKIRPQRNLPSVYLLASPGSDEGAEQTLESSRIQELVAGWKSEFDLIVIDAPSILFQPDAAILSQEADVIVQVATYGVTTRTALRRATGMLRDYGVKQMAVVVEGVPVTSLAYRKFYGAGRHTFKQKVTA
jgi:succinoglycan biosynthesis transport protein ExoP